MNKEEIFKLITANPVFSLATIDDGKPRVRGMLLYKADENGIIFHTGSFKDLYNQLIANPEVELYFNCAGTQIRISGQVQIIDNNNLKDEIYDHPTRKFLHAWRDSGQFKDYYKDIAVFSLKGGIATTWTMADNFSKKSYIDL